MYLVVQEYDKRRGRQMTALKKNADGHHYSDCTEMLTTIPLYIDADH